jgi:hypothetical protein
LQFETFFMWCFRSMRCSAALNILYLESYIGETVSSLVRLQELRFVAGRIVAVYFVVVRFVIALDGNISAQKHHNTLASMKDIILEQHRKTICRRKILFPSGEVIDKYT